MFWFQKHIAMQDANDEFTSSIRFSQASTQELSQVFPSQESQKIEESECNILKV